MPEPLESLFHSHQARLYRLARRLSHSHQEALDLVQETFLRVARSPASVPPEARAAERWLVRTLVNLCRDRWRRLKVRGHQSDESMEALPDASDLESAQVARATVRAALGQLPPRRRAVLVLHELEDLDIAEIARQLGVTRVTVRWHLSAGRRELRRILGALATPSRRSPPP